MSKASEFWDKSAENYDKTEERFEHIHHTSRESAKRFLSANDVLLDYGCGTGTTACELAAHVREIRAIDISDRMIELSKEKANSLGVENVAFEQGDIFDERHAADSFDVILAFNMLHTVPDPHDVIQRAHQLLRPGGSFISVTPCLRAKMSGLVRLQIQLVRILGRVGLIPVPMRRLRPSDLEDLILGEQFELAEAEEIFAGASSYFVVAHSRDHRQFDGSEAVNGR